MGPDFSDTLYIFGTLNAYRHWIHYKSIFDKYIKGKEGNFQEIFLNDILQRMDPHDSVRICTTWKIKYVTF